MDLDDAKESLEDRFKRCKEHIAQSNPNADPWKVCAYLNPSISAEKRARLKKLMAAARKKSSK